jgi:hypothetical protein
LASALHGHHLRVRLPAPRVIPHAHDFPALDQDGAYVRVWARITLGRLSQGTAHHLLIELRNRLLAMFCHRVRQDSR